MGSSTGDVTGFSPDVWNTVFTDKFKSGEGPVYVDCTTTAEKDIEYMLWGLVEEGNTAMLDYMAEEGIDVRKHRVEFRQYEPFLIGSRGIEIDVNGETNVKGLYAAGDEVGNFRADISGAATYGWIAGTKVACVGPETQVLHHLGYEIEDVDVHDMAQLRERFEVSIPEALR